MFTCCFGYSSKESGIKNDNIEEVTFFFFTEAFFYEINLEKVRCSISPVLIFEGHLF